MRDAQSRRSEIESTLDDLNEKLKTANFREKSELRASITEVEESRVRSTKQHQEMEQEGCHLLLPSGYDIDALSTDGHHAVLTPDAYHPSARLAIQAWSQPSATHPLQSQNAHGDCPDSEETATFEEVASDQPLGSAPTRDVTGQAVESSVTQQLSMPDTQIESEHEPNRQSDLVIEPTHAETQDAEISEAEEHPALQHHVDEMTPDATCIDLTSVEPDVEVNAEAGIQSAEEEVNVSHFLKSPTQARERLEHCLQTMEVAPAIALENIALLWIKEGQLPLASKTLELAGRTRPARDLLSLPLVQAAYQGMHVWRGDSATVTRAQQSMNHLSTEIIESWSDRRPGEGIVGPLDPPRFLVNVPSEHH